MLIHVPDDPEEAAAARAAIIADGRLTFGAIGLLLVILNHAPEWRVNLNMLSQWTCDRRGERGEDPQTLRRHFEALDACGYGGYTTINYNGRPFQQYGIFAIPQRDAAEDSKQQVVYVIGQPGQRIAKIGTTSNLPARLRAIQTGHPFRLEVLWSCPGGRRLESWLHEGLAARRLTGEWFDFGEFDPVFVVRDGVRRARVMGVE